MKRNKMMKNIAYSCNDNYVPQTGISMISLFENNRNVEDIHVYFIEKNVSSSSIEELEKIASSYNRKFTVISFDVLCSKLRIDSTGRHIATVYAKLFFSGITGVDKILYLDSDTIINDSLEELFQINIDDCLLAEVETFSAKARLALGMKSDDLFFNDGVTLLNLKKMRELNMEDSFIEFIAKYDGHPPLLSEGTISAVCRGKILSLHPKYNLLSGILSFSQKTMSHIYGRPFYSPSIIKEAIENPVIIHFLSAFYNRPWCKKCTHPYKDKFLHYKSLSVWRDLPLEDKDIAFRVKVIKTLYSCFPDDWFEFLRKIKSTLKSSL